MKLCSLISIFYYTLTDFPVHYSPVVDYANLHITQYSRTITNRADPGLIIGVCIRLVDGTVNLSIGTSGTIDVIETVGIITNNNIIWAR